MTEIFAGVDIETTGLEPGDHRIIEVYVGLYREDGTKAFEYETRIDPQRGISADAQRVHGITHTDLIGKPLWPAVAPILHKVFLKGTTYVWHNGDEFDGPFLDYEFKRIGLALPEKPSIDTMAGAVWATPDGKKPRLGELCFACGVDYDPDKAHAAHYDVDKHMECFFKARAWGYFPTPILEAGNIAA